MAKTLFVTPDFTSEVTQCRTLRTPNNAEWLGVFNKALLTMLNPYNWEQINDTDLTVDETIALVTEILLEFWETPDCGGDGCLLPGLDTPPFRLGIDGHFEMLDPATGEWGTPTGEYEIPPTPPREEATAEERRCLAATNAAHVIGLVYEAITDEIALGGDALQVAAAMVAALVTALGGWIAAPVYAIIQLTIALFAGMIELLQVLGADVWTEGYQEHLQCVLYNCSTDTAEVVTFDLTCIRENLYEGLDLLSPTVFYDAQIYAQVLFLIETITLDGLNAAGATTALTSASCDCDYTWCKTWDFTVNNGAADGWGKISATGTWISGRGYVGTSGGGANEIIEIEVEILGAYISNIDVAYNFASTTNQQWRMQIDDVTQCDQSGTTLTTGVQVKLCPVDPPISGADVELRAQVVSGQTVEIRSCTLYGTGDNPFGLDNC